MQELRVTFYIRVTGYCLLHELPVTFYIRFTSYYLLHELRVNFYIWVTSCYLLHELQVKFILRVTNYYLLHKLGLWYWLCKVSLIYQLFISLACSLQNQVFLLRFSWAMYFMNECSNVSYSLMCKTSLHFYDLFITTWSIPSWFLLSNTFREYVVQR